MTYIIKIRSYTYTTYIERYSLKTATEEYQAYKKLPSTISIWLFKCKPLKKKKMNKEVL